MPQSLNDVLPGALDLIVEDLRSTGDDLYNQFNDEDRAITESATRRIADLQVRKLTADANVESIQADLDTEYSILLSTVAKYEALARKKFSEFLLNLLNRVIDIVYQVIVPLPGA